MKCVPVAMPAQRARVSSSSCRCIFPPCFLSQGILGSLKSGKSALVNKYITGSYVALEKPDGKKHKKKSAQLCLDRNSFIKQGEKKWLS